MKPEQVKELAFLVDHQLEEIYNMIASKNLPEENGEGHVEYLKEVAQILEHVIWGR